MLSTKFYAQQTSNSNIKETADRFRDHGDLVVVGEKREQYLAIFATECPDVFSLFKCRVAQQTLELLRFFDEEQWHIHSCANAPVANASIPEALPTKSQVTATEVEKQQPTVDHEAIRFQAQTLQPSKDVEWEHHYVD